MFCYVSTTISQIGEHNIRTHKNCEIDKWAYTSKIS